MSLDVYYFTEMPYHYIDDELAEQWPSLRLTFPNSYFDPNKATDLFKRYLDEFQYAGEVGFQLKIEVPPSKNHHGRVDSSFRWNDGELGL